MVDIAGLVRGASTGEGLGNQFLGAIRTTDAVLHVVRAFEDGAVAHPSGRVDPLDDAETIDLELILADQEAIERRLERVAKTAKSGDRDAVAEQAALKELTAWLDGGQPARSSGVEVPRTVDLLTAKPTLYVANIDDSGNPDAVAALESYARERGTECIAINAKIEAELAELSAEEASRVSRRPRDRAAGARPHQPLGLPAARPDPVLHHRPEGDASVDDPARPERPDRSRADPLRPRAGVHPCRGDLGRAAARGGVRGRGEEAGAGCASRAATTSWPTATALNMRFNV